jgi:hypothetical protein
MEPLSRLDEAIRLQKSFGPHLRTWRWPTAIGALWFALVLVLPASWFRMFGGLGEIVRLLGVLAPFAVLIFVVAAVGSWWNNRARAIAFEQALGEPSRIERVLRVRVVSHESQLEGGWMEICVIFPPGREALLPVAAFTDGEIEAMVAEIAARAPRAIVGTRPRAAARSARAA